LIESEEHFHRKEQSPLLPSALQFQTPTGAGRIAVTPFIERSGESITRVLLINGNRAGSLIEFDALPPQGTISACFPTRHSRRRIAVTPFI